MNKVIPLALALFLTSCQGSAPSDTEHTHKASTESSRPNKTEVAHALNQDFQTISKDITPAVVSITTTQKTEQSDEVFEYFFGESPSEKKDSNSLGSGVIVNAKEGYILTNHHVIQNAANIKITLGNGKEYQAELLGADPPTDLAVLKLKSPPKLTQAPLGDSDTLKIGEWVLAIGNPFGLNSTVTAGIISARGRANVGVADFEDFIQTDAAINPGNSGGALINTRGEVIGINTAIASRNSGSMGIGFAIPSNMAQKVMQDLIDKGRVIRSQLGIMIGPLDEDLRQSLKLSKDAPGILVMDVLEGTPAEKAGFQKYDVIQFLNKEPVLEVPSFRNHIALTPPETEVQIQVLRGEEKLTLKPLLKEAPGSQSISKADEAELSKTLGFEVQNITPALQKQLKLSSGFKGVVVSKVDKQSKAAKQGLARGDLITEVNREPIKNRDNFLNLLKTAQKGDTLLFNLIRGGQSKIIALTIN